MRNLTKVIAVGLFIAFAFTALPSQSEAILSADVRGGYYTDWEEFFLGAGLRIGVMGFKVVPNVEYVFISDATLLTLNVDGQYDLIPFALGSVWVGGGLGMIVFDTDAIDSQTDGLVNLLAGVGLNVILKPYAQAKYIISDNSEAVFSLGVRF